MPYYPVLLAVKNKKCIVIGGGKVAARKAKGLLECEAMITVISPFLEKELQALAQQKLIKWENRPYRKGDLKGVFLAIAATDDPEVQKQVFKEAQENNVLINVADGPQYCSFILPALVKRGDLSISISTGGKSPALAREIRKSLEPRFGREYEILVDIMGAIRPFVLQKKLSQPENKLLFQEILHKDLLLWIRNKEMDKVAFHISKTALLEEERVLQIVEQYMKSCE